MGVLDGLGMRCHHQLPVVACFGSRPERLSRHHNPSGWHGRATVLVSLPIRILASLQGPHSHSTGHDMGPGGNLLGIRPWQGPAADSCSPMPRCRHDCTATTCGQHTRAVHQHAYCTSVHHVAGSTVRHSEYPCGCAPYLSTTRTERIVARHVGWYTQDGTQVLYGCSCKGLDGNDLDATP